MPEFFTTFHPIFATGIAAREALEALRRFAVLEDIPKTAIWRAYRRKIGIIVTAEWSYGSILPQESKK